MAQLRWGDQVPTSTESARTRLIDAAEQCFERYGVAKTTVEDVATAANVSRATVYRYFDGRDALILGMLEREGGRFMKRLDKRIVRAPDLETAVVEGVLFTVKSVRGNPRLALLFAPEAVGLTVNIPGATDAMFKLATQFLRPFLEAADQAGQLRPGIEIDDVAEWIVRIVLSLLTTRLRTRSLGEQRRFLEAFLVPAIVHDASAPTPRKVTGNGVRRDTVRRATPEGGRRNDKRS